MSTDTIYIKRAIADYVIDALSSNRNLDGIKLFVRGGLPSILIPQQYYPYCEVLMHQEDEAEEYTGNRYTQVLNGLVTVTEMLTKQPHADQINLLNERLATVPSYDRVEEYVSHIVAELQKSEHRDLGGLTAYNEVTWTFTVIGPRVFGIDQGLRVNNWENFGSVPFQVKTERWRD